MHWLGRFESWALLGPDPDIPWSSWRGGLCERTGPSVSGVAGLSRRNFSKRKSEEKRHSGAVWGILQQQIQPPFHLATWWSRGGVGCTEPTSEAPGRVRTTESPMLAPIAPRSLGTQMCGTSAVGELSAGGERRRAKLSPLSLLHPKRPAKLAWPV